jgi:hypothetical protein
MSTQAGASYMLKRVAVRAGVGVWRNRGGVMLAAIVAVAVTGYVAMSSTGLLPSALAAGGSGSLAGTDCADTAIAAVADKSTASVTKAYQCMDPSFQQRVPEADFVRQMQAQKMPNVDKLNRVGDYHTPSGGTMVYYALDSNAGQSVGYIVYVGQNGKVLRIE